MYVILRSSTCFEQHAAHPQEDKLYHHSLWYRHPVAVVIQFVLLRMSSVLLETC